MRMHLTKYAAIAGVLAVPLAVAAPASATSGGTSGGTGSAFGISASGLVNIPETPAVTSSAQPSHKSLVEVPGNPLVHLSILRTQATPGRSEASVVDLKVLNVVPSSQLKLPLSSKAVLSAKLITARCVDGAGTSQLVKVKLAGQSLIEAGTSPNSTLTVPVQGLGDVQVTINKQVRNADGSLTVTALELAVAALGKTQLIDISSATCSAGESTPTPPGEAPKPTPVPSDLPVTG
ncbi:MAG: hypothetical protein JWR24_3976 [Actinoallomurus sp.]|nr:hypothetical protein [Actinoallomurus sp.]